MGYAPTMFDEIGQLSLPSREVLDVGAQDVAVSSAAELELLNRFIRDHNPGGEPLKADLFPFVIEAREVYTRGGFSYTCIDVDERPGTLRVDLARFEIPRPRGRYGLVVNVGTTEHLASPAATFALMHEMCAEGGILYHDVPLFGLGNHGLMNPTPKFWHALIWMNGYAVQGIRTRRCDESALDRGNFFHEYLDYIEGLGSIADVSYLITAVLRKATNWPFVVPYDAVFDDDKEGMALAKLLVGSYRPFIAMRAYSEDEVVGGINHFLEMNGRSFRLRNLGDCTSLDAGHAQAPAEPLRELWRNLLGRMAGASKAADGPAPVPEVSEKPVTNASGSEVTGIEPSAVVRETGAASPVLSADDAVIKIAGLIQSGEIAIANKLADEALASFPDDWRIHQQKARALEQADSQPVQNIAIEAAKHYFKAAELASVAAEDRPRAPALISQGRSKLAIADSTAAMSISKLLVDQRGQTTRPLLIVLSTLPKSASAYLWMSISNGLCLSPTRASTGVSGDSLLETIDAEQLEKIRNIGGAVMHGHFAPQGSNTHALNSLEKVLVHVRDPRQTVLSWAHFMGNSALLERQEHNNVARVLSHLVLQDRIDWAIDYYLPRQLNYLQLWMDSVKRNLLSPEIKFLRQEDLVSDSTAYFNTILDFLGIERLLFMAPSAPHAGKLHFRRGATDEWRMALSATQIDAVQKLVSDELLAYFGWQR